MPTVLYFMEVDDELNYRQIFNYTMHVAGPCGFVFADLTILLMVV